MVRWYPDLAEQVLKGLYTKTQPSLEKFAEGAGYLPDWDIVLMQGAYSLEPDLLHPAILIERVPYTRPDSFAEHLSAAARRGWLYEGSWGFGLTGAGREVVEGIYELDDRLSAKIEALSHLDMARLLYLSDRAINNIMQLPEPARKPAFELGLLFDRGLHLPLIVQVRQRIFILLAFRDDTHITSWRPYELDGHNWEAFTLIWREQAGSAGDLYNQLPHRNYTKKDYAAALETLVARGWISFHGNRYVAQEAAARMRQEVEDSTDKMFAAAFNSLVPVDMHEFQDLMRKFALAVEPQKELAY